MRRPDVDDVTEEGASGRDHVAGPDIYGKFAYAPKATAENHPRAA